MDAAREKALGNACFGEKKFAEAIGHYGAALRAPGRGERCNTITKPYKARSYCLLTDGPRAGPALTQLNRVPIVALAWKLCIAAHSVRSCHQ